MRLDLLLIRHHPGLSRRKAREVIEKGQVSVEGARVLEPGLQVRETAPVEWNPHRPALPRARSSLPLLHADEALVVVDKPPGLLTVASSPDAEGEDTAKDRVEDYAQHLHPRRPYVGVVHRIDRDTSGAVVFALDPAARAALRTLFREHRIERRYLALVEGLPPNDEGRIELPIHDAYAGGRRRVARPGEPSRPAVTLFRVLERFPAASAAWLEVTLETGRQHQIRVHLAHVGLPILGDRVYGKEPRSELDVPRQMLHAGRLAFAHPTLPGDVRVESPLPPDMVRVLGALRAGRGGAPGQARTGPGSGRRARGAPSRSARPPGGKGPRRGSR